MNHTKTTRTLTANDSLEQLNEDDPIELPVFHTVEPVNSLGKTRASGITAATASVGQRSDDDYLVRLGKKPLLKREFGFMSMLGFSCSALLTWEGILVNTVVALLNGGPAGVVWGFLINCKFCASRACTRNKRLFRGHGPHAPLTSRREEHPVTGHMY